MNNSWKWEPKDQRLNLNTNVVISASEKTCKKPYFCNFIIKYRNKIKMTWSVLKEIIGKKALPDISK